MYSSTTSSSAARRSAATSGVDHESVSQLLEIAVGVIVGTALKRDGETTAPVDGERVAELVTRADEVR